MDSSQNSSCKLIFLFFSICASLQSQARSDTLKPKSKLSVSFSYFRDFSYSEESRFEFDPQSISGNASFKDTFRLDSLGKGLRLIVQSNKRLKGKFKDLSSNLALVYTIDWSSARIARTQRLNAAGSPIVFEESRLQQLSFLPSITYYYNKIQFTAGFSFNVWMQRNTLNLYNDRTTEIITLKPGQKRIGPFFSMTFPVYKNLHLNGQFVLTSSNIFPGVGMQYYFK
jgi:hypothetical protein